MKASQAQVGMTIAKHGYTWIINKVSFDPYGNTGNQPRFILVCDSNDAPIGYTKDCALGYLPDAELNLI